MENQKFLNFDVDLDSFIDDLKKIINKNNIKIEKLLNQKSKNYQNFVKPLEEMEITLEEFFTPLSHLNSVNNSEKTQDVYTKALPLITEYSTKLSQNLDIYNAFKEIAKEKGLNSEQKRVIELNIQNFELSGAHLEDDKKKRLEKINLRKSELSNDFSQNLIDVINEYEMILNEEEMDGVPEKEKFEVEIDGKKMYKVTLQMPSYIAYMTYATNRKRREELYRAYVKKAPQNAEIIDELMELRDEMAKILGFENYASYSLATKMAKDENSVVGFLENLANSSLNQGKAEIKELKKFANLNRLESYDLSFYSERLKKEKYDFDEEKYRVYFEKNSVVEGLFKFLNRLFGLEFKEVEVPLWDEKAKAYDIFVDSKLRARLYLDLESRKGKKGGAWMHNWQSHYVDMKGEEHLASAFVVCNFPDSTKTPSLLRHSDVVTLFHEMGHALHHLLSDVSEFEVSGINGVEWDAVEFPSQFLENFAYESKVLEIFAKHYETKEPLPREMIEKILEVKNFQSALGMLRQMEFSLFDFRLHQSLHVKDEVQKLLDSIRQKYSLIKPPKYNKFQNGFSHIFAGGYAAGYYSYKWAEVLSADAFFAIVEEGIFGTKVGRKYLEVILKKGGSKSMRELFVEFMGREPKEESLLKLAGIDIKEGCYDNLSPHQ